MKTFGRNFILAMLAYVAAVVIGVLVGRSAAPVGVRIALGLLPLIPGIFVVFAVVGAILAQDEMQQRIQLEALAFAFGGMFLLTLTESLLEPLRVITASPFGPGIRMIGMSVLWVLGQFVARRRYE